MSLLQAQQRGKISYNWLKGFHYLSSGQYYNPLQQNYGRLSTFSTYSLEKMAQFEKQTLTNKEVYLIILKGALRQNNDLDDRFEVKQGQVLHLICGKNGLNFQNQNQSENDVCEFIQITLELENHDLESKMNIIDYNFDEKINENNFIVQQDNNNISYLRLDKDANIKLKSVSEKNGFYAVLLKGSVQIDNNKKQFQLQEEDAYLSYHSEEISITGQDSKEKSTLIILDVDISKHDEYLQF